MPGYWRGVCVLMMVRSCLSGEELDLKRLNREEWRAQIRCLSSGFLERRGAAFQDCAMGLEGNVSKCFSSAYNFYPLRRTCKSQSKLAGSSHIKHVTQHTHVL
jgi:hypothetical protein